MIFFGSRDQNYIDTLKMARHSIESTYDCKCDIIEYSAIKNAINKRTEHKEIIVLEKQPCRISYKNISNTNDTENKNNVIQIVKLFIAPEIQIKNGSKIVIFKNENKKVYKNSGEPAIYDTHQEIILENFKGWA